MSSSTVIRESPEHDVSKSTTVCTAFEGSHQIGAAALLNSLHASGFDGRVVCGYKGEPPRWASSVAGLHPIDVEFRPVNRREHLTYLKPWLLKRELEDDPTISRIVYLDPDVVVKCAWTFIETWMDEGIAAVEDVNGNIPELHPMRIQWRRWLLSQGISVTHPRNVYVNAGFVGVTREDADVLNVWWDIIERSTAHAGDLLSLKNKGPNDLFHSADQDALNMALEVISSPISWIGPEGMDFSSGGATLSHAIGPVKPWHGKALRRAIAGYGPSRASAAFLQFANGPIEALTARQRRRVTVDLRAAQAVARFYARR